MAPRLPARCGSPHFEMFLKVVENAGRGLVLVLVSSGEKVGDGKLLEEVRDAMDARATGIIFGRNLG